MHGTKLKDVIHEHMHRWRRNCELETGLSVEAYLDNFYRETDFIPAIKQHAPDLLEEVRGIADGSGWPYREILTRQMSDEEPWYRRFKRYGIDPNISIDAMNEEHEHCTAIAQAAYGDRPNVVAQNMDCSSWYQDHQTIVHVKECASDVEAFILTVAGKLSLCGMNNYGVGVCCNTVHQLDHDPRGLPEDFIVRKILTKKSVAEVIDFMHSIPHASGQNYTVGDPNRIVYVECGKHKVAVGETTLPAGQLVHTNHPLLNDDTAVYEWALAFLRKRDPNLIENMKARATSLPRFNFMTEEALERGALSERDIVEMLQDHTTPVCLHAKEGNYTVSLVIFSLFHGVGNPVFKATAGPGCNHDFEVCRFD